MTEKILIISFSNLAKDPRVNRQIQFLRKKYKIIAAGTGEPNMEGVEFVSCNLSQHNLHEKMKMATLLLFNNNI